jgi:hypothetical protein
MKQIVNYYVNAKLRFFQFFVEKILKVSQGDMLPLKYTWIETIFFPFHKIKEKYSFIHIDMYSQTVKIYGVKYSLKIFESLGINGMPIGQTFKLISRENGDVTIQKIYECTD